MQFSAHFFTTVAFIVTSVSAATTIPPAVATALADASPEVAAQILFPKNNRSDNRRPPGSPEHAARTQVNPASLRGDDPPGCWDSGFECSTGICVVVRNI
ncbi:hypothetical protein BDV98DRAFT_594879 [Pterulicium gracile]|uniref:CBM1 domain-containing protein n=1 Tax=Pterulicium gracile TaxID=1884261 RepID=A0A5C3QEP3_9AGAR|nr:hypothetical protein BDV98DRAFT_594879 [Pterula gracilis]